MDSNHPKTELQEITIKEHGAYPVYTNEKREKKGQLISWRVQCTIPGTELQTSGECGSIQEAETSAAKKMLALIRE